MHARYWNDGRLQTALWRCYCPRGSDGLYIDFVGFFPFAHDNSWTAEPSASWNVAATSQQPIEFQDHRSKVKVTCFLVFFCVHDAAGTRGQYLALSKAWWSCLNCICFRFGTLVIWTKRYTNDNAIYATTASRDTQISSVMLCYCYYINNIVIDNIIFLFDWKKNYRIFRHTSSPNVDHAIFTLVFHRHKLRNILQRIPPPHITVCRYTTLRNTNTCLQSNPRRSLMKETKATSC